MSDQDADQPEANDSELHRMLVELAAAEVVAWNAALNPSGKCLSLLRLHLGATHEDWLPEEIAHIRTCKACECRVENTWHPQVGELLQYQLAPLANRDQRIGSHLAHEGCKRCQQVLGWVALLGIAANLHAWRASRVRLSRLASGKGFETRAPGDAPPDSFLFDDGTTVGYPHKDAHGKYRVFLNSCAGSADTLLEVVIVGPPEHGEPLRAFAVQFGKPNQCGAEVCLAHALPDSAVVLVRPVGPSELTGGDAGLLQASFAGPFHDMNSPQAWSRWAVGALAGTLDREIRRVLTDRFSPKPASSLAPAQKSTALAEWLRRVNVPAGIAPRQLEVEWRDMVDKDTIIEDCRRLLRDPDVRTLKDLYHDARTVPPSATSCVQTFLREIHLGIARRHALTVEVDRPYFALLSCLGAAVAQHPVTQGDPRERDHMLTETRQACFKAFGAANGPARDLEAEFHGEKRKVQSVCMVPVLSVINGQGYVDWLHVERIDRKGTGEFYAHRKMAFRPTSTDFSAAIQSAWDVGHRAAQEKSNSAISTGDVRWYLTESRLEVLDGGSMSAALAGAVTMLLRNIPVDSGVALAAQLRDDGTLAPVSGIAAKVAAAFDRPGQIRLVIVHERDLDAARQAVAAKDPNLNADKVLVKAATLAEAVELMRKRSWWWIVALIVAVVLLAVICSSLSRVYIAPRPDLVLPATSSYSIQDNYSPTGIIGNTEDVKIKRLPNDTVWFQYTAAGVGEAEWDQKFLPNGKLNKRRAPFSGVVFQSPAGNWGQLNGGQDLRKFKPDRVVWEVRRLSAEPFVIEFFVGSDSWVWKVDADGKGRQVTPPFPETLPRTTLCRTAPGVGWQTYAESVRFIKGSETNLERVVCAFGWVITPDKLDGKVREFEIRNIRYERSNQ